MSGRMWWGSCSKHCPRATMASSSPHSAALSRWNIAESWSHCSSFSQKRPASWYRTIARWTWAAGRRCRIRSTDKTHFVNQLDQIKSDWFWTMSSRREIKIIKSWMIRFVRPLIHSHLDYFACVLRLESGWYLMFYLSEDWLADLLLHQSAESLHLGGHARRTVDVSARRMVEVPLLLGQLSRKKNIKTQKGERLKGRALRRIIRKQITWQR